MDNGNRPLRIRLFGSLQIRRGDVVLGASDLGGPKPRQILEILLLHRGRPVSNDLLIELLWAGHPPAEAQPTLKSYISVLRRYLQPGQGKFGPLQTASGGYVIDPGMVDLDLDRFAELVRAGEQAPAAAAYPLLCQALELAGEPLLGEELTAQWAEAERNLHAARVTAVTVRAAELAAELGVADEAIGWAHIALEAEPFNEQAWTALVLALEQAGRYAEGLQAYERYRRRLNSELGCAPGTQLQEAHARLLRATAESDGDLSDALSALLYLHEQLVHGSRPAWTAGRPPGASVRAAGNVLNRFLQRAMMLV